MRPQAPDTVTLKIPRLLYERLQQLIEDTGFRSVTEFTTYVLRDLASQPVPEKRETRRSAARRKKISSRMTQAELKAARERLRELGYL